MQFYIDSSKYSEIEEISKSGILSGVTTNPSLLKAALSEERINNLEVYIKNILKLAGEESTVSLQVTAHNKNYKSLAKEGFLLYEKFNPISNNVVIKIPTTPSYNSKDEFLFHGLKAISILSNKNIPVNTTLIITPCQAVLAAYSGASYVSPFVGRKDDYLRDLVNVKYKKEDYYSQYGAYKGSKNPAEIAYDKIDNIHSGVHLVEKILDEFDKRNLKTKVLAASVRNVKQVEELWKVHPHIASLPYNVFKEALIDFLPSLISHPKTFEGVKKFSDDAPKEYKKLIIH